MSKVLANFLTILIFLAILCGWGISLYQIIIAPAAEIPLWGKWVMGIVLSALLLTFLYVIIDRIRTRKRENLEEIKW